MAKPGDVRRAGRATAASSWVRREPISMHGRSPAAASSARRPSDRAVVVEMRSRSVSSTTASANVRLDDQERASRGSSGSPSAYPQMSPVKRYAASQSRVGSSTTCATSAGQLGVVEAERLERVQQPADAGHHAVPAALRQPAPEQLEDRAPVGRPGAQGGLQHGQLVVVGEQRRAVARGRAEGHGYDCATMGRVHRSPGRGRAGARPGRVDPAREARGSRSCGTTRST